MNVIALFVGLLGAAFMRLVRPSVSFMLVHTIGAVFAAYAMHSFSSDDAWGLTFLAAMLVGVNMSGFLMRLYDVLRPRRAMIVRADLDRTSMFDGRRDSVA